MKMTNHCLAFYKHTKALFFFTLKRKGMRAGETAWWVKCLPHKPDGQSLDSSGSTCKQDAVTHISIIPAPPWGNGRQTQETSWNLTGQPGILALSRDKDTLSQARQKDHHPRLSSDPPSASWHPCLPHTDTHKRMIHISNFMMIICHPITEYFHIRIYNQNASKKRWCILVSLWEWCHSSQLTFFYPLQVLLPSLTSHQSLYLWARDDLIYFSE